MAAEGDPARLDDAELIRDGLRSLREEGDADGLLRTARSILYWAERLELADPGTFDQELAMFAEPDLKALRCAIRQGEHVLRAPAGNWQTKAMALLAEVDKHPILSEIAARGRTDLAAAGMEAGELRDLSCQWSPEDSPSVTSIDFYGHKSPVTGCRLLADTRQLATCDMDEVLVWDTDREALVAINRNDDRAEVMDLCGPRSGAWLCTVHVQGGSMGMSVSNKAALKLWDLRAGGAPRILTESTHGPYRCELSPDEKWLVAHYASYTMHFWNTATWERSGVINGKSDPGRLEMDTPTCYAPDGSWFALADADGSIGLWDPQTLVLRRMLDGHRSEVSQLAVPDDAFWLASTDGSELCIWDTREGTLLVRADASDTGCSGLVADPAGRWVAACFGPDSLRIIPVTQQPQHDHGTQRRTPLVRAARRVSRRAHSEIFVAAICRIQDGNRIMSVSGLEEEHGNAVSSWHVISCWDAATGYRVSGPANRPGNLPGAAVPPNGRWAALVGDYEIAILNPETTDTLAEFDYSPHRLRSATFDSRSMAAGFESGIVRIYRPGPSDPAGRDIEQAPADLAGCFAPPHGRSVIAWSGWRSRQAVVLDPSSGGVRSVLRSETTGVFLNKTINACCHAPDGSWVATADDNGTVRVWDPETGGRRSQAAGRDGEDFLPGDCASAGWMATSTTDGRLWTRDQRGARQHEIRVANRPLSGCAGADSWLAVEHEASISIWNPLTGAHLRDLPGRFAAYRLPPARGDVPLLACTEPSGQVTILNPVTGQSYGAVSIPAGLDARRDDVRARAAHPDMRWVVVSDSFGGLDAWDVQERELIRLSRGYDTPVMACSVTMDGTMLATAEQTGVLRVWDTATWRQIARVRTGGPLADCCWSPAGTHIYAVGNRGAYCYEAPLLTDQEW
jgi:WD40 repeat protein